VYRACIKAASSFRPIANEVASFRALLEITEETIILIQSERKHADRVTTILSACNECLIAVQITVGKCNALPASSQRTWERMEWDAEELSELESRLGRNISLLSALNSNLARWVYNC
jgi:hypothetical protein